jgi:hypothetical protein
LLTMQIAIILLHLHLSKIPTKVNVAYKILTENEFSVSGKLIKTKIKRPQNQQHREPKQKT